MRSWCLPATRRGWVTPIILPRAAYPASSRNCGNCVVFPLPVSPTTIVTGWRWIAASKRSLAIEMGSFFASALILSTPALGGLDRSCWSRRRRRGCCCCCCCCCCGCLGRCCGCSCCLDVVTDTGVTRRFCVEAPSSECDRFISTSRSSSLVTPLLRDSACTSQQFRPARTTTSTQQTAAAVPRARPAVPRSDEFRTSLVENSRTLFSVQIDYV